ncbi:MAG: hypothetical protein IKY26_03590 [Erysipelotrichaceae bacterium]|nr:hypothetical protein [Erysipelotrichaceae bacterium]
MRKCICLLCILLLCSCGANHKIPVKRIEEGYTIQTIEYPNTYGRSYQLLEKDGVYSVEYFTGSGFVGNEIFKTDDFTICEDAEYDSFGNMTNGTYTYVSADKTTVLYSGKGVPNDVIISPGGPKVFEMDECVYFAFYTDDELVMNEIVDGKLIEIGRYPLIDYEYDFVGYVNNNYEVYYLYRSKENYKLICDEKTYVFNDTDRVIVLKDYIMYSTVDVIETTGTYILNRQTGETKTLDTNIYLLLDPAYLNSPTFFYGNKKDNAFIFMEKDGIQSRYVYGVCEDNEFKMYPLPITYSELSYSSIYKENVLCLMVDDNGMLDFNVITINK